MQQQEQQEVQRVVGRPFKKGRSGNPGGRSDRRIYLETFAALASELGGEDKLTASQKMLIDTIAKLKSRIGKRDEVRIANAVAKLMRMLGLAGKKAKQPDKPSLTDYVRQTYGES
jgi:hypothetical protein